VSKKISSITGVPANTGDFVTLVSLLFCEYWYYVVVPEVLWGTR
jgi:hypothetical protein